MLKETRRSGSNMFVDCLLDDGQLRVTSGHRVMVSGLLGHSVKTPSVIHPAVTLLSGA